MDGKIEHSTVKTNGINIHVASLGSGPTILFLHGFPELWYTWRHQMVALSALGYRCVAPDLRGFGDTDAPPSPESYTVFNVIGDLVGLIDHLGADKVFVVAHDWGAIIAWYFCLFRPDRVNALVNLSVPFFRRNPNVSFIDGFRATLGDDFYMCRFQIPGKAEAEFSAGSTVAVFKRIMASHGDNKPPKEEESKATPEDAESLPGWLSEADIKYFADTFDKTGFTGGLNYYRAMNRSWELLAPWTGAQVKVPTKFIVGDLDLTYHIPGMKEYIHSGEFKKDVPDLQEVVIVKGAAHFINLERADEINAHIFDFIKKF